MANKSLELVGAKELKALFAELPKRVVRRGLKAAVTAGSAVIAKAAKAKAPRETGQLKQSIGRKIKGYKKAAVGIVGARKDVGSAVVKRFLKRGNVRNATKASRRVPANYLHLVEHGTKAHKIGKRSHPGTKANPFLTLAFYQTKLQAVARAAAKLKEVVEREARSLGKR